MASLLFSMAFFWISSFIVLLYTYLQACVLRLQFLPAWHQAGIHASVLDTSFEERSATHAMFTTKLRYGRTRFGLL